MLTARPRPAKALTRRRAARLSVLSLAAALAMWPFPAPAAPSPAGGTPPLGSAPDSYSFVSASSGADGVRVFFDIEGYLPVSPILSLGTVAAEGFVESTRRTAMGLLPDPGATPLSAPGLIAGLLGVPNVPGYPMVARAEDPFTPEADASLAQGSGVGTIHAEASDDHANAFARLGGAGGEAGLSGLEPVTALVSGLLGNLGLELPGGGALLRIGAVEARVAEQQTSPTALAARASSSLSGVELLGGLIRIASIETTASAHLDGATAAADPPSLQIGGVTVAGIPARVTEQGLELGGSASALDPLLAPVLEPLLASGVRIGLTSAEASADGTTARSRSAGLTIEVRSDYQGYPAVLRLTLGEARAVVQAVGPRTASATAPATAPVAPLPASAGGVLGASPPRPSAAPASSPAVAASPAPAGAQPTTAASPAAGTPAAVFDFRGAYAAVGLLALSLGASRLSATSLLRRRAGAAGTELKELYRW